jgi:hypothetical protein
MHPQEKKKPIGLYPCICFWRATNVATTNKNRSLKRNRYFTKGDISLSKLHLALYTMLRTGQYHVTNEEPKLDAPAAPFQRLGKPLKHPVSPSSDEHEKKRPRNKTKRPLPSIKDR